MVADLHCHSRYSDGSTSIENLIKYAKRANLDYIALTDHDTLAGIEEAKIYGEKNGVKIVTGVECSCLDKEKGRAVHMLCYQPKDIATLQNHLNNTLESRKNQKLKIIENLKKLYPITQEDVLKLQGESQSIYECHIMQALADMGYTNTICGYFMYQLMSSKGNCYVPTDYCDVKETVKLIKDCGGIAVLAHPEEYDSTDLVVELAEKKLIQGVEIFHPRNNEATRTKLYQVAKKHDLIITGGSDFHGQFSRNSKPLGFCTTDNDNLNRIISI